MRARILYYSSFLVLLFLGIFLMFQMEPPWKFGWVISFCVCVPYLFLLFFTWKNRKVYGDWERALFYIVGVGMVIRFFAYGLTVETEHIFFGTIDFRTRRSLVIWVSVCERT